MEMLAEVEEGPAHDFLKRVTDIHRLHLFDIIMQFRALFAEEALGQVSSRRSQDLFQAGKQCHY